MVKCNMQCKQTQLQNPLESRHGGFETWPVDPRACHSPWLRAPRFNPHRHGRALRELRENERCDKVFDKMRDRDVVTSNFKVARMEQYPSHLRRQPPCH